VPPSRLVPRVAGDLETICLKCLHKEPQKRYESAQALAEDLDRYRDRKPIKARRTPVHERAIKWARRRPLAASVAMVLLGSLCAGIIWGIAEQRRKEFEKDQHIAWAFQQQHRGVELSDHADKTRTPDEVRTAREQCSTFLQEVRQTLRSLGDEGVGAKLAPTLARIEAKQGWLTKRLETLESEAAARERDRANRALFQKFLALRQEAQLYAARFWELGATDRIQRLRDSAHAALAIYAEDPRASADTWTLANPLPTVLSEAEKTRVRDGCYDLLLILTQETEPAEGLRILDRAIQLRPQATAAYYLRRAHCLERAGDRAGQDRARRAAQQLEPVTAFDYFLNGRELAALGRLDEAVRLLDTAVQRDLDQTSAHLLLAVCYFNQQPKQLSAARSSLNACIRSHPELVELYLIRALAFGEEGSQSRGKAAADAFQAAEADYRQALELKPGDDLRYVLLANRGLLRLRSGRLDEAVADLDAAIWLKPEAYQAHNTMALVLQRQGRLDEAATAYGHAIACHPEPGVLAGLYRNRALLYAHRKDITPAQHVAALRDLEQAIDREPDKSLKASDQVWRARLFFAAGRPEEGLAAGDAALKLIPDHLEAHRVRVATLMELKRYDAVLASADAYLARGKPIAEILEIRGLARQARRDYAGAIADFTRALDVTPESEPVPRSRLLNRRGWGYQYADAPRLARSDFEESLRLEPNQSDAYGGRGLALIRLGEWRPAVDDAEAGIRQARAARAGSTSVDAGATQVQALFNAARIYAQAVEFAAYNVSRVEGERAVTLYRRYRTRALDLLDEALDREPDPARRAEIRKDPALQALRLRTGPSSAARGNRFSPSGMTE
jgi:tetratricopeptide (TPR) repeat protein